jgi:GPH family glycoside/pentoside/hexuronide:cation symporter
VLVPLSTSAASLPGELVSGANLPRFALLIGTIMIVGLGASTAYLIPWSLLPDAIDADPDRPAGLYTAWMVLTQKIGIGISIQFLGVLLSLSGYQSARVCGTAVEMVPQPASALLMVRFCMGLIPAVLVALALILMRRWPDRGAHLQHTAQHP